MPATTRDVGELLSSAHAREKAVNRRCLLKILSNLRFLARQACAIRGHGDETDGNFHQLLKLRSEDDKMVWLTDCFKPSLFDTKFNVSIYRFLSGWKRRQENSPATISRMRC